MGISEALRWTADNLPRGPPDLQPVKDACWTAYGLGQSATTAIGTAAMSSAARAGGLLRSAADLTPVSVSKAPQLIKAAVTDPDSRERIGRTAWGLADLVLAEASKPFTGGLPVYRVVKEGWTKGSPRLNEGDKKLRERLESIEARLTRMEAEGLRNTLKPQPSNTIVEKPEDVVRAFISKGFKASNFVGGVQVIPKVDGKD